MKESLKKVFQENYEEVITAPIKPSLLLTITRQELL